MPSIPDITFHTNIGLLDNGIYYGPKEDISQLGWDSKVGHIQNYANRALRRIAMDTRHHFDQVASRASRFHGNYTFYI